MIFFDNLDGPPPPPTYWAMRSWLMFSLPEAATTSMPAVCNGVMAVIYMGMFIQSAAVANRQVTTSQQKFLWTDPILVQIC